MSILPLGDSTADRPGRDYQDRLNGVEKLPRLIRGAVGNPQLASAGWFKEFWGPSGGCPIQLMGFLASGEFVYFRAKGSKVELEVSPHVDAEPHAHYRKTLDVIDCELGTGVLPESICVAYISRWLGDYVARCGGAGKRFVGEKLDVIEPAERIRLGD